MASGAEAALKKVLHFEPIPLESRMQGWQFWSVAQDPEGFIWLGTSEGLLRFDGNRFEIIGRDSDSQRAVGPKRVQMVYVDGEGDLWVGSTAGLSRFDRRLETFRPYAFSQPEQGGVQTVFIDRIAEDASGDLWLGHFFVSDDQIALRRLDKETGAYTSFRHDPDDPGSLPAGGIQTLYVDREDVLWVSTYAYQGSSDLAWFDRERGVFQRFFNCDAAQPECPRPETESDRPDETWVGSVLEDDEGRIWINGDDLILYDRESHTYSRFDSPSPSKEPASRPNRLAGTVVQDASGMLWYDDHGRGLTRLDPEAAGAGSALTSAVDEVLVPDMVLENELTLYRDHGGMIWVCDGTERIRRFDPETLALGHVALPEVEASEHPEFSWIQVVEDAAGALWLGDINFGLYRLDRESGTLEKFGVEAGDPFSLHNAGIRALYVSSSGTLWMATNLGMSYYDAGTRRFHYVPIDLQPDGPPDVRIHSIAEDDHGRLWLGSDRAIYRLDPSTWEIVTYPANTGSPRGLSGQGFTTGVVENDTSIWIGGVGTLSRLDPKSGYFTQFLQGGSPSHGIGSDLVKSIERDAAGQLWVASTNGLYRFEPGTGVLSRVGRNKALDPQSAYGLLNDPSGHLWVATFGEGLWRYSPTTGEWAQYDVRDGLAHDMVASLALSSRGELLVGTRGGLNVFDPARLPGPREPPQVRFTRFLLGNAPVPISSEENESPLQRQVSLAPDITLEHTDYLFAFEFAAPGYRFPRSVRYAYQLVGFDDHWIETGPDSRHATYTNVPPGNYMLRVRAAGRDGAWSPHEATIALNILPPWWRTWWAYSVYVLAFLLAVAAYVRLRTLALTRRTEILEQTVAERTARIVDHERQIERQAVELRQALDLKEKLITNISHEFRTPLTLILGPVRRLLEHSPDPGQAMQLQTIKRSGLRLLRLVDQLLGLARLGNSENHAPRDPHPVVPTARAIVQSFQPLAAEKNLAFDFQATGEPWIQTEPDALEVVLLNLLSNAIKYTPSGGSVHVEIGETPAGEVELVVSDTGIGIPVEEQDAVFERFRRAGDNEERIPGAGVGLALVSEVVEAHGGTVELNSMPAEGTTVRIRIPGCERPEANANAVTVRALSSAVDEELELLSHRPVASQPEQPCDDNGNPCILIVEDNLDLQQYLADMLRSDYRCDVACDGQMALERAREEIPDLVLLDVMLPRLDGFQVCRALKGDDRTSHIPIIMLTARQDRESRLGGWQERADAYFTKPFDDDELKLRIASLLEIRDILKDRFREQFFASSAPHKVLEGRESQFVKRLEDALDSGHSDPEFGVSQLASEVYMSTRQLQRKLKSIAGHSPAEYIRSYRLRRSRELLQSGLQVGLVSDRVGFSSPAYFSSCFKAQFGLTPSEYQQRHGFQASLSMR